MENHIPRRFKGKNRFIVLKLNHRNEEGYLCLTGDMDRSAPPQIVDQFIRTQLQLQGLTGWNFSVVASISGVSDKAALIMERGTKGLAAIGALTRHTLIQLLTRSHQ